jgi:hypothetical protein
MFGQLAELPEPPAGACEPAAGAVGAVEPELDEPEPVEDEFGAVVDVELSAAYAAAPPPPTTTMLATASVASVGLSLMWIPPLVPGGEPPLKRAPVRLALEGRKNG